MLKPSRVFDPAKCWNLDFANTSNVRYVTLPKAISAAIDAATDWTVMLWGLFHSTGTNRRTLFSILDDTYDYLIMGLRSNAYDIGGRNDSGEAVQHNVDAYITNDTWVHLAAVYTGSSRTLAAVTDGVTRVSGNFITGAWDLTDTYPRIGVDGRLGSTPNPMDGHGTNLAIFSRALSDSEISYWMYRYLTGREKGLIAYYPFLDRTGTTLKDWSNNKNDGTITDATWSLGV